MLADELPKSVSSVYLESDHLQALFTAFKDVFSEDLGVG
jgi:hypothetical protein